MHPTGTKDIANFWDKFSPVYTTHSEPYNMPISLNLALQTHFHDSKTVLETGCGSGFASTLINNILKPGTTYCCVDLSKAMLDIFQKRYRASDFVHNPANSFKFCGSASHATISPKPSSPAGVSLQLYEGNSEALPFVDGCFDAYIAPASLYVVSDPAAMIKESHRVLKKGGSAGFSVFGHLKDSTFFHTMTAVLGKYAHKYGVEIPKEGNLFHLGEDEANLTKMFKDAGFAKVKTWHEHTTFPVTAKEYLEEKSFNIEGMMKKFPADVQKELLAELTREVQAHFVDGTEVLTLDFFVAICTK